MERRPHLVRCAGLLLLLAGVGAQKKLLEKVLKKTTTLKPRLLQTSDGKHPDDGFQFEHNIGYDQIVVFGPSCRL